MPRFWDIASKVTAGITLALCGVVGSTVLDVNAIKSNRFTATDGLQMEARVHNYINGSLRQDLKAIEARLDDVLQRLARIEALNGNSKDD